MAYSADSFVADEQPTTAKWNKLWSNDASFNDGTGIADGVIAARHMAAGAVVQVVQATDATNTQNSTGTYADTSLSKAITPTDATNKVLVMISQMFYTGATNSTGIKVQILRGVTAIVAPAAWHLGFISGGNGMRAYFHYAYLDSPASASAQTYKTQFAISTGGGTIFVNQDGAISTIVLAEITA